MRSAIVSEILGVLNALNTEEAPFPTAVEHTGDDQVYNEAAAFPFVSCGYAGGDFTDSDEVGAITYTADFKLEVAIATKDSKPKTHDGHAAATALADRIETALHGLALSSANGALLNLVNENLVEAWAGRFLFVQAYRVRAFISR